MAKRNVTEIVKEYLTAIGLRKVKREELDEAFLAQWQRLQNYEHFNGSQDEVYRLLHQDVGTSLKAFGYIDYDFYLYCLKELYYEDFEGEVLDVGCGNGILTCFIAKMNPEAFVLGIDQNREAIEVARSLASSLKLDNIAFENKEMSEISDKYDHVLSIRTVHENIGFLSSDIAYYPFAKQLLAYKEIYGDYGQFFAGILKEEGELVSIERSGFNASYLSYLLSLGSYLLIAEDSLESREIKEGNNVGHFQQIKAKKENGRIDILNLWLDHYDEIDNRKDKRSLCDHELSIKARKLLEGYETIDDQGHIVAKRCLYEGNKGELLLFQANNDIHQLLEYPMTRINEGKSLLKRTEADDIAQGYKTRRAVE
ncbi:MAG: class I SAM-dependent methyltransferase [Erysipelotrichaceae bacterium]|nr:class I SAM-dependent methyltransferase [Erysipelotrichaceae bacterium]